MLGKGESEWMLYMCGLLPVDPGVSGRAPKLDVYPASTVACVGLSICLQAGFFTDRQVLALVSLDAGC